MAETITTAAELDALPPLSVVQSRDASGTTVAEKNNRGLWRVVGIDFPFAAASAELLINAPFTVLYRPDQPQPVKLIREDVMGAASVECECGAILFGPASLTEFPADEAFRLHLADAVLALLPGRTVAEVKAEALREAAEAYMHLGLPERLRAHAFLLALADRLESETDHD